MHVNRVPLLCPALLLLAFCYQEFLPFYTYFLILPLCFHIDKKQLLLTSLLLCCFQFPITTLLPSIPESNIISNHLLGKIQHLYGDLSPFFQTIFLGTSPSQEYYHDFSSLGLIHLLAISGFHFQTLLTFLRQILSPFFGGKTLLFILALTSSIYFFALQSSPSVLRSFISLLFLFLAPLTNRFCEPLNVLLATLLLLLVIDPSFSLHLGFQLSFLATYGILTYTKIILSLMTSKENLEDPPLFLKILALNVSVFLTTAPILLLKIGSFPWIGLIMNLFFPLLFTPILFALLISLVFPLVASLNIWYTKILLTIIDSIPSPLLIQCHLSDDYRPFLLFIFILILLFPLYQMIYRMHSQDKFSWE